LTLCHLNQFFDDDDDDDDDSHACLEVQVDGKLAVIICHSNMGTKKNIQTQFVSVVSKVISDGIFNERFYK